MAWRFFGFLALPTRPAACWAGGWVRTAAPRRAWLPAPWPGWSADSVARCGCSQLAAAVAMAPPCRPCGGLWGEAAERAQRALRLRERAGAGCAAPSAGIPGRHPGVAQRRGAAGCPGPHRMVQPDGGRPVRLRPAARPDAADHQPGARSRRSRPTITAAAIRRDIVIPGPRSVPSRPVKLSLLPASLWRGAQAAAVARRHGAGAGRSDAPRFRRQRFA